MVKLFIGNCAEDANAEDLRTAFGKYGRVMEAEVINGKGFERRSGGGGGRDYGGGGGGYGGGRRSTSPVARAYGTD